ncbi:MAG TPA: aldolase [Pseudonocardiaceae bacterium]
MVGDRAWEHLLAVRATDPAAIGRAWAGRRRRPLLAADGRLLLVSADHPARGALGIGPAPLAAADRRELLARLLVALRHPRVDGVLGGPDVLDELVLLGALEGKLAFGSLNGGGIAGSAWELDDPLTGHDPRAVVEQGLDGGKMLLRLDLEDRDSLTTLAACAGWITDLARAGRIALVEPLPVRRGDDGELGPDRSEVALVRAVAVAAGLGASSAFTWLTLPSWSATPAACAATTLPSLVLGAVPTGDLRADLARWGAALALPTVRGLVIGRALLYPPDNDVHGAVDAVARALTLA